jgi:hypothetical protein
MEPISYIICIGVGACSNILAAAPCSIALGDGSQLPTYGRNWLVVDGGPPRHVDRIDAAVAALIEQRVRRLLEEYHEKLGLDRKPNYDNIDIPGGIERWNRACAMQEVTS